MNTLYYGDNLKVLREQLLTVKELRNGVEVKLPPTPRGAEAFKKAEKTRGGGAKQEGLGI